MPRKILVSQRKRFWSLYQQGHSIKEAAKRSDFSESYAKKLVREGISMPGSGHNPGPTKVMREVEEEEAARPKQPDELDPVARDCLEDFERFRARYLGSVSTPWQVEAAHRIAGLLDTPHKEYLVLNVPQGGGKTRLASHDIPVWLTARNRALRGIFGSLSQSVSVNLCANLRDTLERTTPALARQEDKARGLAGDAEATLAADYGRFKPTASGGVWRREALIVEQLAGASMEKEPTWAAFSREAKFLGWRVDFMVWDDLVNTDMLRNPDRVDDLYRWWDDEAQSRIDPGGLVLLVGQRLRSNDIYRYCIDKRVLVDEYDLSDDAAVRPMYHHVVYKAHYDEKCAGEHTRDAKPYPDGCMLDPARITWRDIRERQADGNYQVVYQQEDADPSSVLVQKEWVTGCWDEDRTIGELPDIPPGSEVVRYMTCDPSPTKFWAVMDWLYVRPPDTEPTAGYRYLLDLARKKMGANEFLDWSRNRNAYLGLAEDWVQRAKRQGMPITWLVMERNAAQRWAMRYEFFRSWCQTRGVTPIEHETTSNKADDTLGVWATLPNAWRYNRIRLPGGDRASRLVVAPFVTEVTTYPGGATDDCVMSSWFGEYNLDDLIASVSARTNDRPFYNDFPSAIFGDRPPTPAERHIAALVNTAS